MVEITQPLEETVGNEVEDPRLSELDEEERVLLEQHREFVKNKMEPFLGSTDDAAEMAAIAEADAMFKPALEDVRVRRSQFLESLSANSD